MSPREHAEGAAPSSTTDEDAAADVVDFDALHAALGELPPPPTSSSSLLSESQGRMNATYASVRPHAIPSTRPPATDPNVPAVIVAPEDQEALRPSQKTLPLGPTKSRTGGLGPGARGSTRPGARVSQPPAPRLPRPPTLMVRPRGPTKRRKLIVFMALLLVFVGGGIAFLIFGKHIGIDLAPPR